MGSLSRLITAVVAALWAGAYAEAQKAPAFDACSRGGPMTPEGIGPLRIGLTSDSLKKVCRVISERRIADYAMTRFLIPVGSDTVVANEQGGHIFWIEVRSKSFRTPDSLGVGSPLGMLLTLENLDGGVGDGDDAYELNTLKGPQCGLVFWIDGQTAMAISDTARRHRELGDPKPTGLVLAALRQRAKVGTIVSIDIRGGCGALRPKGGSGESGAPIGQRRTRGRPVARDHP
jgi:hypothetical protein